MATEHTTNESTEIVRQFQAGLNANDFSVVDRYVAPSYVSHDPNIPSDKTEWKLFLAEMAKAHYEYYTSIDEVYEEEGKVYVKLTEEYRQIRALFGNPPDFKRCRKTCVEAFAVAGGLITEVFPPRVLRHRILT